MDDDDNDPAKYDVANYTVEELLNLLSLPSNLREVTEDDVTFIISSNITKYNAKAVSKQLLAPKEAAKFVQLSLFFKDVQAKLLKAIKDRATASAGTSATSAALAATTMGQWDAAVANANAAASANIRARARAEAAESARLAQISNNNNDEEPDVIEQQAIDEEQTATERARVMTDDTEQMRWARNQYLPPGDYNDPNPNRLQATDRSNQFELSRDRNEHYVMKQRRLGIPSSHNVPIAQGTMNPTLRNTFRRTVIINSKRRAVLFPHSTDPLAASSSTNFNVQLSEELKNVVSLRMMSVTIPYTWYAIDAATGTNCFHITVTETADGTSNGITTTIVVPTGNYSSAALIAAIQAQINSTADDTTLREKVSVSFSESTGRCTFTNISGTSARLRLTFFDPTRQLDCAPGCKQSNKINNSLGWILGFRSNSVYASVAYNSFALDGMVYDIPAAATAFSAAPTLTGEAVVDTYGPKYFMIVLDDYKNNRINCGVVSVTSTDTRLDTPYYYDGDIPCERIPDPFGGANDYITVNIPSVPRTLTEAQLYTVNEIRRNRELTTVDRVAEPTASNVFAMVHFNKNGMSMGASITDTSPSIASYTREYFGPITLQRLKVTLVDDNGFAVNLNGNDWSFTFSAESLYEY
jgi:hypothetical protein